MNCPVCGQRTTVIDSRPRSYGLRRRRECITCHARFTTIESPVVTVSRLAAAQYDRGILDSTGKPRPKGR